MKARQTKRKDKEDEERQRKEQRVERAREADRALASVADEIEVASESDLDRLTVRQLQAWMLVKDPGAWEVNKKLKGKQQLKNAALVLYRKLA